MEGREFRLGPRGPLVAWRSLPGLAAIAFVARHRPLEAGVALVVAAAADLLVALIAARRAWKETEGDVQLEGFVDFVCFVWAPAALGLAMAADWAMLAVVGLFVLAGAYRLARFNVEGTIGGGYRGLPVTYSGVVVPAAAGLGWSVESVGARGILVPTFCILAALMASGRFVMPQLRL